MDIVPILTDIAIRCPHLLHAPALRRSCKRLWSAWILSDDIKCLYYECLVALRPFTRHQKAHGFTWGYITLVRTELRPLVYSAGDCGDLPETIYNIQQPTWHIYYLKHSFSVTVTENTLRQRTEYCYILTKVDKINSIALRLYITLSRIYTDIEWILRATFMCNIEIIDYISGTPECVMLHNIVVDDNQSMWFRAYNRIYISIKCAGLVRFFASSRLNILEYLTKCGYTR